MLDVEQGENNAEHGRNKGHRFAPGQSGNPKGRPHGIKRVLASAAIGERADEFAAALLKIAIEAKTDEMKLEAVRLAYSYLPREQGTDGPTPAAQQLVEARRVLEGQAGAPALPPHQEAT